MSYHTKLCNISFESKYANADGNQIDIDQYLSGKHDVLLRCIPNGHELVAVKCTKRHSHFRHKYIGDISGNPMTQWHAEWQSNFPDIEIVFERRTGQFKQRRADILLGNLKHIIEIQHSKIEYEEVKCRMNDYKIHGHDVKWIIHGQGNILMKIMGERRILHFNSKEKWLYDSFKYSNSVYYDINGFIYKVNPNTVKQDQVDVHEPKLKSEFIESLKNNIDIWDNTELPQCFLHVKQQGAGSGKTYGMMQLIDSDPEISNYKYIVFLTKQHAAVGVMHKEFMEQLDKNKLINIELIDANVSKDPKKYIVKYKNKLTNINVYAIFATVDSFMYALGEAPINAVDKFIGIVKSIKEGLIRTNREGVMTYANVNPILNKEALIMIDETQDLIELYGEAFLNIVKCKCTNLCVVGDRLQSLSYKVNALTLLHDAELIGLKVIKGSATNVVRRFSNPTLINFVNKMIPFEKYDLPQMTPHITVKPSSDCLTIFSAKTVYANASSDSEDVVDAVTGIMKYFTTEVETYNRVPEDFLIITPFTNNNPVMEALQIALNMYWKKTMSDNETYISNVKSAHDYWNNINTDDYTRYAIFHKSQDGNSINTKESEHATRMVSIHSSKGDGRKVVFVIGVTQSSLRLFSQVSNNLIYDSLLHVAITRQKEKLYFRLEPNGDDIHHKLVNSGITDIPASNCEFNYMSKKVKRSDICRDMCEFDFDNIYENIISINPPPKLPEESESKLLIDMAEHNIRFASITMNVWIHSCNHELVCKTETKKQFFAILNELTHTKIQTVSRWKDYIEVLKANNSRDNVKKCIPIIQYSNNRDNLDYSRYYNIINSIMVCIIKKLDVLGKKKLDYLCPIESVILYYMIECTQNGQYQSITIENVYNIIDIYSKAFTKSIGHEKCECNKHFQAHNTKLNDYQKKCQEYLCNHYERLNHIAKMLDNFNSTYPDVSWLYSHQVELNGGTQSAKNEDFALFHKYQMIGYNKHSVYIINIKPQFNELNFNEFLIDTLLDTYIIQNAASENRLKFNGKKVVSCVLSMNKTDIYTLDWSDTVNTNKNIITSKIFDIIYKRFENKHEQYHNTFKMILDSDYDITPSQKIEICINKLDKSKHPPKYIHAFWTIILNEIDDCEDIEEMTGILKKYSEKTVFVEEMKKRLNRSLKKFLSKSDMESISANPSLPSAPAHRRDSRNS